MPFILFACCKNPCQSVPTRFDTIEHNTITVLMYPFGLIVLGGLASCMATTVYVPKGRVFGRIDPRRVFPLPTLPPMIVPPQDTEPQGAECRLNENRVYWKQCLWGCLTANGDIKKYLTMPKPRSTEDGRPCLEMVITYNGGTTCETATDECTGSRPIKIRPDTSWNGPIFY